MSIVKIDLNGEKYDDLVHKSLPDVDGHIDISIKENATKEGKPAMVISFYSNVDGINKRVQTICTVKNFLSMATVVAMRYKELLGDRSWPSVSAPEEISGSYKGIKWRANLFEKVYLVISEEDHFAIAGSEKEVKQLIEGMIDESTRN